MVYGLPPPTRLLNSGDGCCWGLPVLAHEVSKHAWGLRLRRVRVGLALSSFPLLPSAPENSVGTPDGEGFRSSISCLLVPLSTLHRLSRDDQCMTRGQDGLLFLSCRTRSEEHTSELQSPDHLVCRLLLEKKKEKDRQQNAK